MAQEPPFKFFPVVPGIPDQLSRRTWPFLPVVRRRPGQDEELGVVFDALGACRLAGYSATVFKTNLFLLPPALDQLLALPHETFDMAEELFAAGWTVD